MRRKSLYGNKRSDGYDSELERRFHLTEIGSPCTREKLKLEYTQTKTYRPDFHFRRSDGSLEIFECKGMYRFVDATKMRLALLQSTEKIARFVLVLGRQNPKWIGFLERMEKLLPQIEFGVMYVR